MDPVFRKHSKFNRTNRKKETNKSRNFDRPKYKFSQKQKNDAKSLINPDASPVNLGSFFKVLADNIGLVSGPSVDSQNPDPEFVPIKSTDHDFSNPDSVLEAMFSFENSIIKSTSEIESENYEFDSSIEMIDLDDDISNFIDVPEIKKDNTEKGMLISKAIDLVTHPTYISSKKEFLTSLSELMIDPVFDLKQFSEYKGAEMFYFYQILNYDDYKFKKPKNFSSSVVYIPSGGGKTTMLNNSIFQEQYIDVDAFIKKVYDKFILAHGFKEKMIKPGKFMSNWFKMEFNNNHHLFKDKILLFNHPNQLPYYMWKRELILLPLEPSWNLRFFNENLLSLISVKGRLKIICSHSDFELIIRKILFNKWKKKNDLNVIFENEFGQFYYKY